MHAEKGGGAQVVIDAQGLRQLINHLADAGFEVLGPRQEDGAIVLGRVTSPDDLPRGIHDEQAPGHYRTVDDGGTQLFGHATPVHAWKRFVYPPNELLWRARREGGGFKLDETAPGEAPHYAFLGVRACDLKALRILDAVLGARGARDSRYLERRRRTMVIAVNCTRSGATCFCASMGTGPRATNGFDLALTELPGADGDQRMLVVSGSEQGAALIQAVAHRPADDADIAAEAEAVRAAKDSQQRQMVPDVAALLRRNLEHRQWSQVAERCLGCANCTLVCPTCFCTTVEDVTDLSGETAERWRKWDSCFTADFTYIHGGSIRRSGAARYRQWITHKLSSWWEQFETSGCVGCGRCITWCPVGIDITEEAHNLRESEGGGER